MLAAPKHDIFLSKEHVSRNTHDFVQGSPKTFPLTSGSLETVNMFKENKCRELVFVFLLRLCLSLSLYFFFLFFTGVFSYLKLPAGNPVTSLGYSVII